MGLELLSHLLLFAIPLAVEAPTIPTTAWEDLATVPDGRLGELVQIHVQAHSRPTTWEPFLTRFSPTEYVCLKAWSDAQMPWVEEHYENPQVIVFARKGSPEARRLADADPHTRLVLAVIPRAFQAGMVWIEVIGAQPTRKQVTEGTVLHVEKALDLVGRDAPGLARDQLVRALAAPLPDHARRAIAVLVARCDRSLEIIEARTAAFRRRR